MSSFDYAVYRQLDPSRLPLSGGYYLLEPEKENRRNAPHKFAQECRARDTNRKEVLVTCWTFEYGSNGDGQIRFDDFERRLEDILEDARRRLLKTDDGVELSPFATHYLRIDSFKRPLRDGAISYAIRVVQQLPFTAENLTSLSESMHREFWGLRKKQMFVQLATRAVFMLDELHQRNFFHGWMRPSSVWITRHKTMMFSDAYLTSQLLNMANALELMLDPTPPDPRLLSGSDNVRTSDLREFIGLVENYAEYVEDVAKFLARCRQLTDVSDVLPLAFDLTWLPNEVNSLRNTNARLVEEYAFIRQLGTGNSTTRVLCVMHRTDKKLYAIKRIEVGNISQRAVQEEVEKLAMLKHDNIVRYHTAFVDRPPREVLVDATLPERKKRSSMVIKTELCECSSLRHFLANTDLHKRPDGIWGFFHEILMGLDFMHDNGIAHCDIKPENVFINRELKCKLGDFGLCRNVDTLDGLPLGTEAYAAPEILHAERRRHASHDSGVVSNVSNASNSGVVPSRDAFFKADVYSLGLILYEMVDKGHSEEADDPVAYFDAIRACTFPGDFGEELRRYHQENIGELKRIILWMLDLDPTKRPSVKHLLSDSRVPNPDGLRASTKVITKAVEKKGTEHTWMMSELFRQRLSPAAENAFDEKMVQRPTSSTEHSRCVEKVEVTLRKAFCAHGVVHFDTHSLVPAGSSPKVYSRQPFTVLDKDGRTLALSENLRDSFVRHCVKAGLQSVRRYQVGKIFTWPKDGTAGDPYPLEKRECAVDLVGEPTSASVFRLEAVSLIADLCYRFLLNSGVQFKIVIGHSIITDAICKFFRLAEPDRHELLSTLWEHKEIGAFDTANRDIPWRLTTHILLNMIGNKQFLSQMLTPVATVDQLKASLDLLLTDARAENPDEVASAIDEIDGALEILGDVIPRDNIVVDVGLVYREHTFKDGLLFFVGADLSQHGHASNQWVAVGGRYDSYFGHFENPNGTTKHTKRAAYGIDIDVDTLAVIESCKLAEASASKKICVAFAGEKLVNTAIILAGVLRRQNPNDDISVKVHPNVILPSRFPTMVDEDLASEAYLLIVLVCAKNEASLYDCGNAQKSGDDSGKSFKPVRCGVSFDDVAKYKGMHRQAVIVALFVGLLILVSSEGSDHSRVERGLFGGKKTTTAKPKLSTDRFGRVDVREMTTKKPGLFSKLAGKLG